VYAVGMEEGLFPSSQSLYSLEDLEEERRLFYVAITRAESKLMLTYATSRYKFGTIQYADASRFIKELPEAILDLEGEGGAKTQLDSSGGLAGSFGRTLSKMPLPKPLASKPSAAGAKAFIPDDVANLQIGTEVTHEKFGDGKVIFMEGNSIDRIATIFFPNFGEKKIMLKFAKLKIIKS
jgi:DNA helicase-2/ATP-dependent DNA helicase PcrA